MEGFFVSIARILQAIPGMEMFPFSIMTKSYKIFTQDYKTPGSKKETEKGKSPRGLPFRLLHISESFRNSGAANRRKGKKICRGQHSGSRYCTAVRSDTSLFDSQKGAEISAPLWFMVLHISWEEWWHPDPGLR